MDAVEFVRDLTYDSLKTLFAKKGYRFFEGGDYDLNIFGMRLTTGTDEFDDVIGVAYKKDGLKVLKTYAATTEPGLYYLKNLLNEDGCAIMVPGQYRGLYKIGPHGRKRYTALRQKGKVKVFRDGDLDNEHDMDPETIQESRRFYTNLHQAFDADKVRKNSAGCQVVQMEEDFDELMEICHNAAAVWGNSFTYTLFDLEATKL